MTGDGASGGSEDGSSDPADGPTPNDTPANDDDMGPPAQPAPVDDYNQRGPYEPIRVLNVGAGLVSGGTAALLPLGNQNDADAFTLFYPDGGGEETFPILTFGNGTLCSPTFYDEFIGHVVSYGYIVIGPNTSNTGTGEEMLQGVDWVVAENEKPDSPLYGKVNTERVGALGHSQGGSGTTRAAADPRIDAIATLSGGTADVSGVECPAFFVTSGGEAGSDPEARVQSTLSQVDHPSMYGVTVGGGHDEYADIADQSVAALVGLPSNDGKQSRAAVTAWFDWQLQGYDAAGELFLADPCAFCNDENLQLLGMTGF